MKSKLRHFYTWHTFLKYFLSYFILLAITVLIFFFAMRNILGSILNKELQAQARGRISQLEHSISSELSNITSIDQALQSDINLIRTRYQNHSWYQYQASQRLQAYTSTSSLLQGIIYIDQSNDLILSTRQHVRRSGDLFEIYYKDEYLPFKWRQNQGGNENQLIILKGQKDSLLLFLPSHTLNHSYDFCYILDSLDLQNRFAQALTTGIEAVGLIDNQHQWVIGVNQINDEVLHLATYDNFTPLNKDEQLYQYGRLPSNLTFTALISTETFLGQVSSAFAQSSFILLFIMILGIGIIVFVMRFTYKPLKQLTDKIVDKKNAKGANEFVQQIDQAFTAVSSENIRLSRQIEDYTRSIQQSLLDQIVHRYEDSNIDTRTVQFDEFLENTLKNNGLFLVKIIKPAYSAALADHSRNELARSLPTGSQASLIEKQPDAFMLLLHYAGHEPKKRDILTHLLNQFGQVQSCRSILSQEMRSLFEIPAQYERVSKTPLPTGHGDPYVIHIETENEASTHMAYPHESLEAIQKTLEEADFDRARSDIQKLFKHLDDVYEHNGFILEFYVRSILVDLLSAIIHAMNALDIKPKAYIDPYFQILDRIRERDYASERETILTQLYQLIEIFESEYDHGIIQVDVIKQMIQEEYASPDLTITGLAEHFHVSIAYMSFLFKKNFDRGFTDYLWQIRCQKACELLQTTEMTIEEISVAVGYANTSSFRRKFKKEIGMTPSEYRSEKESLNE